jgi:hypothetical protein
LVDADEYTEEDIAELYGFRWNVDGSFSRATAWEAAASDQFYKHLSVRALIMVIDCQWFCRKLTIGRV